MPAFLGENFIFLTPPFPLRAGAAGGTELGLSASSALWFLMKSPHGTISPQPCQEGDEDLRKNWGKKISFFHFFIFFASQIFSLQSTSILVLRSLERTELKIMKLKLVGKRFIPWCPRVRSDVAGNLLWWRLGLRGDRSHHLIPTTICVEVTSLPAVKFALFYLWMMLSCRCQSAGGDKTKGKMLCFKVFPISVYFFKKEGWRDLRSLFPRVWNASLCSDTPKSVFLGGGKKQQCKCQNLTLLKN